jgi:hypothetical protein
MVREWSDRMPQGPKRRRLSDEALLGIACTTIGLMLVLGFVL